MKHRAATRPEQFVIKSKTKEDNRNGNNRINYFTGGIHADRVYGRSVHSKIKSEPMNILEKNIKRLSHQVVKLRNAQSRAVIAGDLGAADVIDKTAGRRTTELMGALGDYARATKTDGK